MQRAARAVDVRFVDTGERCGDSVELQQTARVSPYNEHVFRIAAWVCVLGCGAGLAIWYYENTRRQVPVAKIQPAEDAWLDHLYSQNPAASTDAALYVERIGAKALPKIHATLQDPKADTEHVKAALKACAILGPAAASAIGEVAEQLPDPALTAEAAIALSFMGRAALPPLRDALASNDSVVRRESLRSIGKLKDRARLEPEKVLPLLVRGMKDPDAGVRSVAATYLGILHEGAAVAVPALTEGLVDPEPDVRRASAAALGSFGTDAEAAVPALRKASLDADPDVAREAGVALVKLQPKR
jgi:HEAT repeat protein